MSQNNNDIEGGPRCDQMKLYTTLSSRKKSSCYLPIGSCLPENSFLKNNCRAISISTTTIIGCGPNHIVNTGPYFLANPSSNSVQCSGLPRKSIKIILYQTLIDETHIEDFQKTAQAMVRVADYRHSNRISIFYK